MHPFQPCYRRKDLAELTDHFPRLANKPFNHFGAGANR